MRVLSKDERVDLHPPQALPIDLRESFLPMQILIEEDSTSERNQVKISQEYAGAILERTEFSLGLHPLTEKNHGRFEWLKPQSIELTRFSFPEKVSTNRVYSAYGLLALDRILTHEELKKINIQPIPGYLYLAAREQVHPHWRGPLGDIEMCVNARCVHSFPPREIAGRYVRHHILATPFELPPGFVIGTVGRLNELRHRVPRVAELFRECVLNPGPIPADYTPPYDIPRGVPELNDERRWIFSKRPWFVQHILLSRIIGGSYWKSNLIKYELKDDES